MRCIKRFSHHGRIADILHGEGRHPPVGTRDLPTGKEQARVTVPNGCNAGHLLVLPANGFL